MIIPERSYRALLGRGGRNRITLENLFDRQVDFLYKAGVLLDPDDVAPLAKCLPDLGLFVLIPPWPSHLSYRELTALIKLGTKRGNYGLPESARVQNEPPFLDSAYLLSYVDDGLALQNTRPEEARVRLAVQRRHAFNLYEGLIFCILFPEVLLAHGVELLNSTLDDGSELRIQRLQKVIRLYSRVNVHRGRDRGAPSYRHRIIPGVTVG